MAYIEPVAGSSYHLVEKYNPQTINQDVNRLLSIEDSFVIPDALGTLEWLLMNYFYENGIVMETDTFEATREEGGRWRWVFKGVLKYNRKISFYEVNLKAFLYFIKFGDVFEFELELPDGTKVASGNSFSSLFLNFPVCIVDTLNGLIKI
jgi:hypothetical protein